MHLSSNVKLYVALWAILVIGTIVSRFTVFSSLNSDGRFPVFMGYCVLSWLPAMALNLSEGMRLRTYLEKRYPDTWRELLDLPGTGPGGQNSLGFLKFLFSLDDLGDANVTLLKDQNKAWIVVGLAVFVSQIPMFLLIMAG
jgi:hypothetical protein